MKPLNAMFLSQSWWWWRSLSPLRPGFIHFGIRITQSSAALQTALHLPRSLSVSQSRSLSLSLFIYVSLYLSPAVCLCLSLNYCALCYSRHQSGWIGGFSGCCTWAIYSRTLAEPASGRPEFCFTQCHHIHLWIFLKTRFLETYNYNHNLPISKAEDKAYSRACQRSGSKRGIAVRLSGLQGGDTVNNNYIISYKTSC